jgi:hypothetical protein
MQYAKIGDKLIALEPTGFWETNKKLLEQTNVSIYELWKLYSFNNFDNPMAQADEEMSKNFFPNGWNELTRDIVRNGGKGNVNGRLHVQYIANSGKPEEKISFVYAPESGFWVPTNDGVFQENTGIPFDTVYDYKEAIKLCEAKGIPKEHVSQFHRLNSYNAEKSVERIFQDIFTGNFVNYPALGRFCISMTSDNQNNDFSHSYTASRRDIKKPEVVMEVKK